MLTKLRHQDGARGDIGAVADDCARARRGSRRRGSGFRPSLRTWRAPCPTSWRRRGRAMTALSLRRKDSRTAFFSHWLTRQPPAPLLGDAQLAGVQAVRAPRRRRRAARPWSRRPACRARPRPVDDVGIRCHVGFSGLSDSDGMKEFGQLADLGVDVSMRHDGDSGP